MSPALDEFLGTARTQVDHCLAELMAAAACAESLDAAMRYAVMGTGKRLRPALTIAVCEALQGDREAAVAAGAAVELIHAYSLVHDDLPAMDDDALRRGQPTVHVKWDEATAILAGDALQSLAFETLATHPALQHADRASMVAILAAASGRAGMAGGQALDMSATAPSATPLALDALEQIHRHKTGALIIAAVQLGALAAGVVETNVAAALTRYAQQLGLAFQVVDDVLDVVADPQALGKPVGSDAAAGKHTYATLLGIDGARDLAERLCTEAHLALSEVPRREILEAVITWTRDRGT